MSFNRFSPFAALCVLLTGMAFATTDYTIKSPSMTSPTLIVDWEAYNGTVAHQATINSSGDPTVPSGSLLFTFTNGSASLTQDIGVTASGQDLTGFAVDLAHDGQFTNLILGFYEYNAWDIVAGSSVDVITLGVPADTTGALDTFTTVQVPHFAVNTSTNPIRLFIGTSCTGGYGGATVGAKFAIDNVRLVHPAPAAVRDWTVYQ